VCLLQILSILPIPSYKFFITISVDLRENRLNFRQIPSSSLVKK
jgi:hypothetical protein